MADTVYLMSASVASLLFWGVASCVAVLVLSNRSSPSDIVVIPPQFAAPGDVTQKSSCAAGVDSACAPAKTLGEQLACKHKKLVECYAEKRIPDGVDPAYTASGGDATKCLGMVAYASNGVFSNRTTFPVCLAKNQSVTFPVGHPYRYVSRDPYFSYAVNIPGKPRSYVIPTGKKTTDGKVEYSIDGAPLPYGLNEHLVRLKRDYGYDVIPVYSKGADGVLRQVDLPTIALQVNRYK